MQLRDDERYVPADLLPPGLYERVRALVNAAEVREGYTMPWLAGRSPDGKRLYPDVHLPFDVAGVKTRRTTGFHELAEWLMMNKGHTYDADSDPPGDAHYIANGVEKIEVEAQGGTWAPYCLGLRPLIKETDDPALTDLPPKAEWDRRPYAEDDPTLNAEIDAADKNLSLAMEKSAMPDVVKDLNLFVPITKIDVAKRLVYGVATAETPDVAGEVCDYATTKPFYQKWSQSFADATDGKSLGNLRAMHGNVAAGKLTDIAFNDDARRIEICAKVVDDAEWTKVQEGVYSGFSQGGRYVKRWPDPGDAKLTRYTAEPLEVSLVDHPCLPDATFSVVKADGGTEFRKFKSATPAPAEPSLADIAERAVALAKAAGNEAKWSQYVDAATEQLKKAAAAAAAPPAPEVTKTIAAVPAVVAGDAQVWINPALPGETFTDQAALHKRLAEKEGEAARADLAAPLLKTLEGLRQILDEREARAGGTLVIAGAAAGTAHADAVTFNVAALDKSLGIFIDAAKAVKTGNDLRVLLIAQPLAVIEKIAGDPVMSKRTYSAEQRAEYAKQGVAMKDGSYPIPDKGALEDAISAFGRAKNKNATKRHIIKRAKALKATDLLPADWPGSTKADKSAAAGDLQKDVGLWSVAEFLTFVAAVSGAEQRAEMPSFGFGIDLPKELCDRFGAAVVELLDIATVMLDAVTAAMKGEEENEAVAAAAQILDLQKHVAVLALAKAGKRHSKADKDRIKQAHDALADLDPDCCPGADNDDGDGAEKLAKAIAGERVGFQKMLDGIGVLLADVAERVKKIEAQPMPMGSTSVRIAEKRDDTRLASTGAQNLLDQPGGLEMLADMAIRKAQQEPMRTIP